LGNTVWSQNRHTRREFERWCEKFQEVSLKTRIFNEFFAEAPSCYLVFGRLAKGFCKRFAKPAFLTQKEVHTTESLSSEDTACNTLKPAKLLLATAGRSHPFDIFSVL
jgi:hypothetical protein